MVNNVERGERFICWQAVVVGCSADQTLRSLCSIAAGNYRIVINHTNRRERGFLQIIHKRMKKLFVLTTFLCATSATCLAQTFTRIASGDMVNTPSDSRSVTWIDANNDGYVDLFISNGKKGGENNFLYLNRGDGTFSTVTGDPIVNDNMPSVGSSWADADNDGDADCAVANWYNQPNLFYENIGKGAFKRLKKGALVTNSGYSETASWGDYDNDGLVDLYVTHSEGNLSNVLYHNDGGNNFTKITTGLPVTDKFTSRSATWTDFDLDGDADLLVGNENQQFENLYKNDGAGNFSAVSLEEITGYNPGNTMSTNSIDFDNDGDLDFFFANNNGFNDLLRNNNDGTYSRLNNDEICTTPGHSFGSNWGDIDNDGDLDVYITNAFAPGKLNNFLYLNNGDGSFSRDTNSVTVGVGDWSYGCAFADYDNDGFLDLAVANCFGGAQRNALYHNNGNENHWIEIQCVGKSSNRSAIGAKVKVTAIINGKEVRQLREISAQSGYCGQNMLTAHIGLGNAARCSEIVIEWPSGIIDKYTDISADRIAIVVESQSLRFTTDEAVPVIPAPITTQDSILCFLDSAFTLIRNKALYADKIDWTRDLPSFYREALSKNTFKESLIVFRRVFGKMEDAHSTVWIDSTAFKGGDHLREKRRFNQELQDAYQNGEARLMAKRIGDFGYIRIPYITINSQTFEAESAWSQKIQDMVCEIYSTELKGWILDLRMDGGGDMYPMITGIQQFLGEGTFGNVVRPDAVAVPWHIKDSSTWEGEQRIASLPHPCLPDLTREKVAVLVSQNTASSGEITALAFKGRPKTLFIGEKSGGLMTANYLYQMPFGEGILPMGILLVLAEANESDRNGQIHSFIYPDVEMETGDNFTDLEKDLKVMKAIDWLSE